MMRRLHSQLYLRIYLAVLASIALSGLLIAIVWHVFYREPPMFAQLGTLARAAAISVGRSDTAHDQQLLNQLHNRFDVGFALYDNKGKLLASAARQPAPQQSPALTEGFVHSQRDGLSYVASIDDHRWLLAELDHPHGEFHVGFLPLLAMIALVVAVCAQPVVRRLTKRLERLKASVDRFGGGDLRSRVTVEGSDEIAAIAHSFNLSAARIEELISSQRALLANASHELRSPLARLRMSVELAEPQSSDSKREEVQRNIAELDQLIEEILLASRLDLNDAAALTKQQIDFTALVAEECARTRAELNAESIHLQGDARLLRRLIRNLLENAVRHGGGTPVEVSLHRDTEESARLEVADRGPGIPAQEREKIFAPFYRLPHASEAEGGVGLGLALVKQIAEKHGGTAQCLSRAGGGSRFVVTLPLA